MKELYFEEMLTDTSPSLPENFELKMEIAGICISIVSENSQVIELLKEWYHMYLSSRRPVGRIEIQINGIRTEGHQGVSFFTKDGHVFAVSQDFIGCMDLKEDRGKIIIKDVRYSLADVFPRIFYSMLALKHDGFLVHSAGIVKEDRAFVFCGPSGAGKTTVARLSKDRSQIVNDEITAVRKIDGDFKLFGTPFWGRIEVNSKHRGGGELKAIFILKQDRNLHFKELTPKEALTAIMSNILLYTNQLWMNEKVLDLSLEICKKVPVYEMHFLPENSFWRWIDEHID